MMLSAAAVGEAEHFVCTYNVNAAFWILFPLVAFLLLTRCIWAVADPTSRGLVIEERGKELFMRMAWPFFLSSNPN